jgi:FkbM family methyltransferase
MAAPDLQQRFQACLSYWRAHPWEKPFSNPVRFFANQLRKYRTRTAVGQLTTASAFHFSPFTIVNGETVSNEIASYGIFEPDLTAAFLRLVRQGEVIADVGMHLGYYATLFASLVGAEGEVHAFEPTESTREIAWHNTRHFPQITVHPHAIWSSETTLLFRDYGLQWMAFNSCKRARLETEPVEPKEIKIRTTTLDLFRERLGRRVSVLKIDAESAEREILKGARLLLKSDQPIIAAEVGDTDGSRDSRLLVNEFLALDYAPWEFLSRRFVRHQVREVYSHDNLIWAPATRDLSQA